MLTKVLQYVDKQGIYLVQNVVSGIVFDTCIVHVNCIWCGLAISQQISEINFYYAGITCIHDKLTVSGLILQSKNDSNMCILRWYIWHPFKKLLRHFDRVLFAVLQLHIFGVFYFSPCEECWVKRISVGCCNTL
jgi:hypothetical protein